MIAIANSSLHHRSSDTLEGPDLIDVGYQRRTIPDLFDNRRVGEIVALAPDWNCRRHYHARVRPFDANTGHGWAMVASAPNC